MIAVYIDYARVEAENLTYSSVDPGGFESCSFTVLEPPHTISVGQTILVLVGGAIAWQGYVEEPGFRSEQGVHSYNVAGVGAGIELKRKTYSMVYIERDVSRFQGASRQRRLTNLSSNYSNTEHSVSIDTTDGSPSLDTEVDGEWTTSSLPICEPIYDAGAGNTIDSIKGTWTRNSNTTNTDWSWAVYFSANDAITLGHQLTADLQNEPTSSSTFSVTSDRSDHRFVGLRFYFANSLANTWPGLIYGLQWTNLRIFGPHGITPVTTTSQLEGLRCSDIARHAFQQVGCCLHLGVVEQSAITIPQSAYREPVYPEQVVDDMARYAGWHWGVWEGADLFSLTPRFFFQARPVDPTISVHYRQCEDLDLTERLSSQHNQAKIIWQDAVGSSGMTTVTKDNYRLPAGVTQELLLGSGLLIEDEAETLATTLLAVDQLDNNFAGSTTLPEYVTGSTNERIPSHLIRPGRDKIQIVGLPLTSPVAGSTDRADVFRVHRLTVAVEDKRIRTQIEFDTGASLLETLNARLETIQTLTGA